MFKTGQLHTWFYRVFLYALQLDGDPLARKSIELLEMQYSRFPVRDAEKFMDEIKQQGQAYYEYILQQRRQAGH